MAISTKNQMLGNLAAQAPIQQSKAVQGAQSAQALQMQQQIGAAGAQGAAPTTSQLQQAGGQMAQQRANAALQAQQQTGQQLAQVGQAQLQQQSQENKMKLAQKKMALTRMARENQNKLAFLDEDTRGKIFDRNMQFEEDDRGQKFLNSRQLADYAVTKAKSAQELKNYEQKMHQATAKRRQVLNAASAKIRQTLEQGYLDNKQKLTQEHRLELQRAEQAVQEKIRQQQSEAANDAAIWSAGTTILGAGASAVALAATGGAAAPFVPAIMTGTQALGTAAQSTQTPKKIRR